MFDDGYRAYCEFIVAGSRHEFTGPSKASICGCEEFLNEEKASSLLSAAAETRAAQAT